ncbi:MAG: CBS domain-containing protein [Steroidobacteraceae bacterium]
MQVSSIMTGEVITVVASARVAEAVRLMLEHRISGLPVVDASGAVVGMLTEGDLLRRVETDTDIALPCWRVLLTGSGTTARQYLHSHGRLVIEVMTLGVLGVPPTAPLAEVVGIMEAKRIRRLPVMEDGRLVGIVSRADVMREVGRCLKAVERQVRPDAQIRADVLHQFAQQHWVPSAGIDVQVHDATVQLRGAVTDRGQREALRVLIEGVPGVREVVDHLMWIEPYTGTTLEIPEIERDTP